MKKYLILLFIIFLCLSCNKNNVSDKIIQKSTKVAENMSIKLSSNSFNNNDFIPSKHTCDEADISPQLHWENVPKNAKSIAIICDDPDAPTAKPWVHWVIYNIPVSLNSLPENLPKKSKLENNIRQGINDFGKIGWRGPCPPSGVHRYYFKIYALAENLNLPENITKYQLLDAMKNHILAQGELIGKYSRK